MDILEQFLLCFCQKLAPARKNSTNWLARLARFCNSEEEEEVEDEMDIDARFAARRVVLLQLMPKMSIIYPSGGVIIPPLVRLILSIYLANLLIFLAYFIDSFG